MTAETTDKADRYSEKRDEADSCSQKKYQTKRITAARSEERINQEDGSEDDSN